MRGGLNMVDSVKIKSDFENQEMIPARYTADGKDISPPLEISGVSSEAKSIVIIMEDPDAPGQTFTHWLIWNIPASTKKIPENVPNEDKIEELGGAVQGVNDFGKIGYGGPAPPSGTHRYVFKIFTLKDKLNTKPRASKTDLLKDINGLVLQHNRLKGKYSR